ncbi:MAG TPA: hypothetical protein VFL96_10855 [Acidobacteriaceae bacterium]|jgi:hypothetical protein|nr:hypothetical protein [Acidobacteriaceae bacterium]
MHLPSNISESRELSGPTLPFPYHLVAGSDPDDGAAEPAPFARASAARDDLPYLVELWDEAKSTVEQVLAVTANGSIGYAAYYAAIREYPHRFVTLRHRNRTVARSNSPQS